MSLIHFAVARSRLPAWLALLAMLLLFIAPVISKSLMAQRGYGEAMMHHASGMMMMHGEMMMHDASGMMPHEDSALTQHDAQPMPHDAAVSRTHDHSAIAHNAVSHDNAQPTPPSSAKTQHAASSLPKHHPMSMMDDSACGYCVLLIHLSIDSVRLPELWTLLQAAIPAAPLQLQPFVASWTPLWFRPRGPPVNAFSVV
ncbi:MAG: DUF2946 family protein [Mixta calida]|uniref:DUF2946 family protein n=2 Tax=Mixta calida TaxID=665913 RepID=UPI001680CB34|nr:DUF2946 family protein [Mixta calida]MDU4941935.1 DUF2946 family protein [Mixta calida]QNU44053.1 DUF2946 domain-containing protein [Mixta calida]